MEKKPPSRCNDHSHSRRGEHPHHALRAIDGEGSHRTRQSTVFGRVSMALFKVLQNLVDEAHRIRSQALAAAAAAVGTMLHHQSVRADGLQAYPWLPSAHGAASTSWPPSP